LLKRAISLGQLQSHQLQANLKWRKHLSSIAEEEQGAYAQAHRESLVEQGLKEKLY
jgi:hypothetical protein